MASKRYHHTLVRSTATWKEPTHQRDRKTNSWFKEKTQTPASLFWPDVSTFIPTSSSKDSRGYLGSGIFLSSQVICVCLCGVKAASAWSGVGVNGKNASRKIPTPLTFSLSLFLVALSAFSNFRDAFAHSHLLHFMHSLLSRHTDTRRTPSWRKLPDPR